MDSKINSAKLPAAEPVVLENMIEYAANSVVSRTLTKSKAGTLTLFAFDAGEGLSEHSTPFDAYVQILDGEATLSINNETVIAGTGKTVLMPANVPHAVSAVKRFKMLLIMIRG